MSVVRLLFLLVVLALPVGANATPSGFGINTILAYDAPLEPGEYVWDTEGVPPGRVKIVVDLAAERLYVYRSGVEIGRTMILYGADHKPTPTGTFTILEKDIDHRSNLYNDAPMPYMLRLTWGGVAIHGTDVDPVYATHGCVGVPDDFGALLYREARLGDQVYITRRWRPDLYAARN